MSRKYNKKLHKKFIFICFFSLSFLLFIFINPVLAQANKTNSGENNFSEKIYFAILGVVLGFVSNLLFDNVKRRREARSQLSYTTVTQKGFPQVEQTLQKELTFLYKNKPTKNLLYVLFIIQNTGNREIRNQYIRLEFSNNIEFLDISYEPKPEREMGFEQNDDGLEEYEKGYNIGYIKPGQKVGIRFIIEGLENQEIKLNPYHKNNDKDTVEFVSGIVTKIRDERYIVQRFIILSLLLLFLPLPFDIPIILPFSAPIFSPSYGIYFIRTSITFNLSSFIRVIIILFIIPLIEPFAKIIANTLVSLGLEKQVPSENTVHINDSKLGALIFQSPNSHVEFEPLKEVTKVLNSQEKNILIDLLDTLEKAIRDEPNLKSPEKDEALGTLEILAKAGEKPNLRSLLEKEIESFKAKIETLPSTAQLVIKSRDLLPRITNLLGLS